MRPRNDCEWNARAYHRISTPQVAWGQRVLSRVTLEGHERVIDAGCGTGLLTADLAARVPSGRVLAVDRSRNMLEIARHELAPLAGERVAYVQANLLELPFFHAADLVFSTAAFHWVLDHPRLFASVFAALIPGGRLIAQCGGAGNLVRFRARADRLRGDPAFVEHFRHWRRPWEFASAEVTAERLADAGFVEIETSLEEVPTPFENAQAFTIFTTNVVLGPYLARLPETHHAMFVARLTELAAHDDAPFVLDYVRLNIDARKPR